MIGSLAEPLLTTLLDDTDAAVAVFDRDLRYVLANRRAADLDGRPQGTREGINLVDVVGEASPAVAAVRRVLASGRPERGVELRGPAGPGGRATLSLDVLPVGAGEGPPELAVTVVRDRTEESKRETGRALAEARLAIAELATADSRADRPSEVDAVDDRLASVGPALDALFESSGIAMAMLSLDLRVLRANRAYAQLLGRDVQDLLGTHLEDLTHGDDLAVHELLRRSEHAVQYDKRLLRPDGTEIPVRVVAWTLVDDDGEPVCRLGILAPLAAPGG